MPRNFDEYFDNRSALTGAQAVAGDEYLVLRSGTVFSETQLKNLGFAKTEDNAVLAGTTTVNVWADIALTEVTSTAALTFATNQWTYAGATQTYPSKLDLNVSVLGTADTDDYEIAVVVNGTAISKTRFTGATKHIPVSVACSHILTIGDVIKAQIRNVTAANDCTVVDAQLVMS